MPTLKCTPHAKLARGGSAIVVALDAVKAAAGARWTTLCDEAAESIEKLFRQKLGPSDHFLKIDELNWLVITPGFRRDDAMACCLQIAYELHAGLFPTCDLEQLNIATAVSRSDEELELTALPQRALRRAARNAGLIEQLLVPKFLDDADARAEACKDKHRYWPIWDCQRQTVSGQLCMPENAGVGPAQSVSEQLKCVLAMLSKVALDLELGDGRGIQPIVFVPLPYDMLSAPTSRMAFLSACRQLDCALRPQMVFEIALVPSGVPKSRLVEIVSSIQPFVRAVTARAVAGNTTLVEFGGTGIKALGIDFRGLSPAIAANEMIRLAQTAGRLGLATYAANFETTALLEKAIRAGIRSIFGPAIGLPTAELTPPARLSLATLMESAPPLQAAMGA